MNTLLSFLVFLAATGTQPTPNAGSDADAGSLARDVMSAHGIESWQKVRRLRFTFTVRQGDKLLLSAKHDWDIRRNRATVEWGGKKVSIDLAKVGDSDDQKSAFARWTNDTYWLLAPLKLADGGVNVSARPPEIIDGQEFDVLRLSFNAVGLTPGDQYDLYIHRQTRLLAQWVYMPNPQTSSRAIWTDYADFNGVKLARTRVIGDRVIQFEDISIDLK